MTNHHRIIGPPGTGKTTTLARWIGDAVERFGSDQVMVTSFTRTAAHEIASRGIEVDRHNVGTLHSICFRQIASEEKMQIAETRVDEDDGWNARYPHWGITRHGQAQRLDDPFGAGVGTTQNEGDAVLSDVNLLRARMTPLDEWPQREQDFYREWQTWKAETGHFDFTDLIEYARDAYDTAPLSPRVIFADEVQDMNPLQLSLLQRWGEATEFYVTAGDADQTLFGFAGCTPEAFLSPDLPERNERILEQSYRVPRAVHLAAQQVIRRCQSRRDVPYLPTELDGYYRRSSLTMRHGRSIVDEVEALLDGPAVPDGSGGERAPTVMLLGTCSYHLNSAVFALRARGVPVHNPFRPTAGNWNPLRGGGERLRDFVVPHLDGRLWTWAELFRWSEHVSARSGVFAKGAKSLIKEKKNEARALKLRAPLTATEVRRVLSGPALEDALEHLRSGRAAEWVIAHATKKGRELFSYAQKVVDAHGYGALTAPPRVIVGTIHSVKGGEADHVVLIPDLSPAAAESWWAGARDPVLRAAYVGLTRARHGVTVLSPSTDNAIDFPEHEMVAAGLAVPF